MGPKQKPKIQLVLLKNNKKTKSNLFVKPNITYQDLKRKISYITSKQFTLEILSGGESPSQPLYAESLSTFLANYNGQLINIVTTSSSISVSPYKPEDQTDKQDQISDTKVEQPAISMNSFEQEDIINRVQGPIVQKFKQVVKQAITKACHQIEKVNYQMKCSQCQCQLKGVYYLCLKCPNQFILCSECEQKQTYTQLKHHKYRAHPFTKVKPYKHQIKSIEIETIQPDDVLINLEQKEGTDQRVVETRKADPGGGEIYMRDLIRMKLDWFIRSYMMH